MSDWFCLTIGKKPLAHILWETIPDDYMGMISKLAVFVLVPEQLDGPTTFSILGSLFF